MASVISGTLPVHSSALRDHSCTVPRDTVASSR